MRTPRPSIGPTNRPWLAWTSAMTSALKAFMSAGMAGAFRADPSLMSYSTSANNAVLDVRHCGRGDHLDRFEHRIADAFKQPFTCPKNYRCNVQVQLVELACGEILPHGACSAGD